MRRRNLQELEAIFESKFWKMNPLTSVSVSLTGLAVKSANLCPTLFPLLAELKQKTAANAKNRLNAERWDLDIIPSKPMHEAMLSRRNAVVSWAAEV